MPNLTVPTSKNYGAAGDATLETKAKRRKEKTMDRKFLEELGLEKETVDKILDKHSADIGKHMRTIGALEVERDGLKTQLGEANRKLEGFDPDWKRKAEDAEKDLRAKRFDFALEKGLAASGARNPKALSGLIDVSKLTLGEGGELTGLDAQLETLKKGEDTAFLFQQAQTSTGLSHERGGDPGADKNAQVNAALRAAFGKE